ncbi:FUSC family protein [Robbsia sp. KACC 23696]|uniref:FUSC family protein n=1 Tax=Robbsia sp. KACC 23696 TaxID=3149231 RepID=UPI00325BCF4E
MNDSSKHPVSPSPAPWENLVAPDWQKCLWRTGLLAWPAIALCLSVGAFRQQMVPMLIVAGGAFTVGLGALQRFTRVSIMPMVLACLGMMLSAWIGSRIGASLPAMLLASAIWAALGGWAAMRGPGLTWICQQSTIALFVAGSFAGSGGSGNAGTGTVAPPVDVGLLLAAILPHVDHVMRDINHFGASTTHAAQRALLVGAGGAVQIVLLGLALACWRRAIPPTLPSQELRSDARGAWATALRAALACTLAGILVHVLKLQHSYWAPMTALVVLKPSLKDEFHSVLQRCIGTIGGATLATLAIYLTHPGTAMLIVATSVFAFVAYTLNRVSYLFFSAALTAYIVCMLGLVDPGQFGAEIALYRERIGATLIGCGIALATDYLLKAIGLDANRRPEATGT